MKAFVIKNKEGKYFSGYDTESIAHFDCDNIVDAIKYRTDRYELQEIKSVDTFKDCEVVEIEIEETKEKYFIRDITVEQLRLENEELEHELEIYKEALKDLSKHYSKLYCLHYCHFECNGKIHCCENGDYKFIMENVIEQAKEN